MTGCPFPDKVQYASAEAAKRGRNNLDNAKGRTFGGRLVVYRCGGHWHVGHQRGRREGGKRKARR